MPKMTSTPEIEYKLELLCHNGVLVEKAPAKYVKVAYCGNGKTVSDKWNVIIYNTGSIVCVDFHTLTGLLMGILKKPDLSKTLVQIDDSGWGFPLGGVMIGIYLTAKNIDKPSGFLYSVIDTKYFQGTLFPTKAYLKAYTDEGLKLLKACKAKPKTHRIEICTGYINSTLKDELRKLGFDVMVTEIKGDLQDLLEGAYKTYIKNLIKLDLYYDPKVSNNVSAEYYKAVEFGLKHCPHLLKTGWKSLGGSRGKKS